VRGLPTAPALGQKHQASERGRKSYRFAAAPVRPVHEERPSFPAAHTAACRACMFSGKPPEEVAKSLAASSSLTTLITCLSELNNHVSGRVTLSEYSRLEQSW